MTAFISALRWDIVVQARNGFYWASTFVVLAVGVLLANVTEAARATPAVWVPALFVVNLQITTFFFVTGLMLLERDEGTLTALAVSPVSPGGYLATRTITLTTLGALETAAVVWLAFGTCGSWLFIIAGTMALGVIYTGLGAAVASRYASVNALLLPASFVVTLLLLPLLPHFGLAPRGPFLLHPIAPALALLRAGYRAAQTGEVVFGAIGSVAWSTVAFLWGRNRVGCLMRDTRAGGGR